MGGPVRARIAVGVGLSFAASLIPATAAWAPSPFKQAWEAQTALGYRPCLPQMSNLPAEVEAEGVVADAADAHTFGVCEIRTASKPNFPHHTLDWVAWHEMCHLSVSPQITDALKAAPAAWGDDPYHSHPAFKQCVRMGPANPDAH